MNKHLSGFTLIELLIVVAIIAILAAIAIPNFLAAQVRSKVSRTKADMRSIATSIESYYVDNNAYPEVVAIFGLGYSLPLTISSPISYISSVPLDPFAPNTPLPEEQYASGSTYWYATWEYYERRYPIWGYSSNPWGVDPSGGNSSQITKWVLMSRGPDRILAQGGFVFEVDIPYRYMYDPSNGTVSRGNIVASGP